MVQKKWRWLERKWATHLDARLGCDFYGEGTAVRRLLTLTCKTEEGIPVNSKIKG